MQVICDAMYVVVTVVIVLFLASKCLVALRSGSCDV